MTANDAASMLAAHAWQVAAVALVLGVFAHFLNSPRLSLGVLWIALAKSLTPPVIAASFAVLPLILHLWEKPAPAPVLETAVVAAAAAFEPGAVAASESPEISSFALPPLPLAVETRRMPTFAEAALVLWAAGAVVVLSCGYIRARRWSRLRQAPAAPTEWQVEVDRWRAILRLKTPVRAVVVDEPLGPAVFGVRRPVLVLPRCLTESRAARVLAPAIVHELIHVRRGDLIAGWVQWLACGLNWFNPLVWRTVAAMSREAERCCDAEAVAALGGEPGKYARSLLEILELRLRYASAPGLVGLGGKEGIRSRMEAIMKMKSGAAHQHGTSWAGRLVMAALAALFLPGAARLGEPPIQVGKNGAETPAAPVANPKFDDGAFEVRIYPIPKYFARFPESDRDAAAKKIADFAGAQLSSRHYRRGDLLLVRHTAEGHDRLENSLKVRGSLAGKAHRIAGTLKTVVREPGTPSQRAKNGMNERVSIDATDRPFEEVVAKLSLQARIPVHYSDDESVKHLRRENVTLKCDGVTFREALRTAIGARRILAVVEDWREEGPQIQILGRPRSGNVIKVYQVKWMDVGALPLLSKQVRSLVRPETWDDPGSGKGSIQIFQPNSTMIVSNTEEVHEEVSLLLHALMKAAYGERNVLVEVYHIPQRSLGRADVAIRDREGMISELKELMRIEGMRVVRRALVRPNGEGKLNLSTSSYSAERAKLDVEIGVRVNVASEMTELSPSFVQNAAKPAAASKCVLPFGSTASYAIRQSEDAFWVVHLTPSPTD